MEKQLDENGFLRNIWYFAHPSSQLKRGEMLAKTLLNEPVLIGRAEDGKVFAMRDICPHRGIPLSDGRFDGKEVECCYHGWRFAPSGQCTCIPSLTSSQDDISKGIRVRSYPTEDRGGGIWIYMSDGSTRSAEPIDTLPELPEITHQRKPGLVETMMFPSHVDHAVIGLMDPAHGPYVHKSWFWRSERTMHEKTKRFGPKPYGFAMLRHEPSSNSPVYRVLGGKPTTEIRFQLPGIRIEDIHIGDQRICGLTSVTPIDRMRTEITHQMFWSYRILDVLKPALRPFAHLFLKQDRDVVAQQQRGLKYDPNLMLINDADMQAKWYFRLKKLYSEWEQQEAPFANPIKETTLSWRS